MSKTPTYKAVAYEHSRGIKGYYIGEGIAFSNSIKQAIKSAKQRAYVSLIDEEDEADDGGSSILATVEVFRGSKKILDASY